MKRKQSVPWLFPDTYDTNEPLPPYCPGTVARVLPTLRFRAQLLSPRRHARQRPEVAAAGCLLRPARWPARVCTFLPPFFWVVQSFFYIVVRSFGERKTISFLFTAMRVVRVAFLDLCSRVVSWRCNKSTSSCGTASRLG